MLGVFKAIKDFLCEEKRYLQLGLKKRIVWAGGRGLVETVPLLSRKLHLCLR